MSARKALGRGLGSLIPQATQQEDSESSRGARVEEIGVEKIFSSRFQPRSIFREGPLKELAASIKERGVIQPIIVTKKRNGYELIAGERRWRAVQLIGLKTVPAIVKVVRDSEALEMAIIENIQREQLNPIEEALAFERLQNEFAITQDALGKKLGRSRSSVANALRLLKLPDMIKDDLADGKLTMGHARALLALGSDEDRLALRNEVINAGMNVRQVESQAKKRSGKKSKKPARRMDVHLEKVAINLERRLGCKTEIKAKAKGGVILIQYSDDDELNRVVDVIGSN